MCMHTAALVCMYGRTAICPPTEGYMKAAVQASSSRCGSVVLLLQPAAARIVVRRRLQAASSRLCRRHDKRNRRWPLAQSHQGTTPAVSSSRKRSGSTRQAREQKAHGAWRWEGRLVVERRLLLCNPDPSAPPLLLLLLARAPPTPVCTPKRRSQTWRARVVGIASLARRLGQRQPANGRENSRGCHARPLGDRHRHAKLTVRRNFPRRSPSPAMILMLNVTSSADTPSVLLSRFSLSAKGAVHLSGLSEHDRCLIRICMLFSEETRATRRCQSGLSRQMRRTLDKTTGLVVCNVTHRRWYMQRCSVLQVRSTRWPLGIRVRVAGSRSACTA